MLKSRVSDVNATSNTVLDIILDDKDEVMECIEQAFLQNNIKKASLVAAIGRLKNIIITTTRAGALKQKEYLESCMIKNVSGTFTKLKSEEYIGDFHISFTKSNMQTINGVLLKAHADGEVKLSFKIIADTPIGIVVSPKGTNLVKEKILNETVPIQKPKKPMIIS